MTYEYVIVGGGLAGLYVAAELERLGHDYLILEARPRLGGRILSLASCDTPLDAGPAWFWPQVNPRLKRLIEELGLAIFPQYQRGGMVLQSETGFIHKHHQSWLQNPRPMRLVGGAKKLIDALTGRLAGHKIRLSCEVKRLKRSEAGVDVHYDWQGEQGVVEAKKIIMAIPPRLFCRQIELQPSLSSFVYSELLCQPTWMASRAKALVVYSKPFWREQGLSGLAISQLGPLSEIYDASPADLSKGALFGFFHWDARKRQQESAKLDMHLRMQLEHLYGDQGGRPEALYIQDWASETFTSTEQDVQQEPSHPSNGNQIQLDQSWSPYLLLAVSEVAGENAGYLEGAVEAAQSCLSRLFPTAPEQKSS